MGWWPDGWAQPINAMPSSCSPQSPSFSLFCCVIYSGLHTCPYSPRNRLEKRKRSALIILNRFTFILNEEINSNTLMRDTSIVSKYRVRACVVCVCLLRSKAPNKHREPELTQTHCVCVHRSSLNKRCITALCLTEDKISKSAYANGYHHHWHPVSNTNSSIVCFTVCNVRVTNCCHRRQITVNHPPYRIMLFPWNIASPFYCFRSPFCI